MSSSACIYIGPYVSCVVPDVKAPTEIRCCSGAGCGLQSTIADAIFCYKCGAKIVTRERLVDRAVLLADVVGEDVFIELHTSLPARRVFLGANRRLVDRAWFISSRDLDELHVDLDSIDRVAEIKVFERHYAEAIAKLRKSFDDVRICWGMHLFRF